MLERSKKILKEKAELILEAFQGPADRSVLDELDRLIDGNLPSEFIKLYLSHNGFDDEHFANLFYGFPFLPVEKVMSSLSKLNEEGDSQLLQFADVGIKAGYTFGLKRVPIGDDSGTSLLCIDLDPDEGGTVGQVIMLDYEMNVALLLNLSIVEMITQFEEDLLSNKYSLQKDALEDGVHWLKPEREIEPGNWFNSPRWQYVNDAIKS